jgi:MFS family permease
MQGRALLFISTFLFMVGTALMNTSFTPYLVTYGVLNNEVFAVVLVNALIQTGAYRSIQFFATKLGEIKMGSYAIVARTGIYLLVAFSVLLLRDTALFVFAMIIYACIGVVFALWNSSTSVILFSSLGPEKQGGLLGGYSALSSFGLVIGSLFSGYLSSYFGYSITFTLAAFVMLSSFFVLEGSMKGLGIVRNETQAS